MPSDRLDGVALVTGGGRGIGASIARELADAGMTVAVTGRTTEQVEAVATDIGGLALVGDVSSAEDVERWLETVERELGPIDLLVANAGISSAHEDVWEIEPEEWWHVHEVNVLGVFLCCRAVLPGMLERRRRANRDDGEWRRVPPGGAVDRVHVEQGGRAVASAETLANQVRGRVAVFSIQPGTRTHGA